MSGDAQFSVARLAVIVMGAGVVGLAIVAAVTVAVAQASAGAALVVALVGILAVIGVMGFVARRTVDRAIRAQEDGVSRGEGHIG